MAVVDRESQSPWVRIVDWNGERQLVAAADIVSGALLMAELPIAFVETHADEDEVGPWILLEGILSSEAMFERVSAEDLKLTKWPLSEEDEATLDHLASKYGRNRKKLAQLYHRVAANNIRYAHEGRFGFGIWPTLSRSNHSCDPNARPCGTPRQPLAELLIATRAIRKDEAICWNYLADDPQFLSRDWLQRNARLHRHFQFLCRCARCEMERPPQVASLSKLELAAFFHRHQGQQAPLSV